MFGLLGAAGSGKSLQGQRLAEKYDWWWLSVGELLRGSHDAEFQEVMQRGGLVDDEVVVQMMHKLIRRGAKAKMVVILDGFPRDQWQAQWLVESGDAKKLRGIIVLRVSEEELWRRLEERGRNDDTREAIEQRWRVFHDSIEQMRTVLAGAGVELVEVNGEGTVEEVQARIEEVLIGWGLIKKGTIKGIIDRWIK